MGYRKTTNVQESWAQHVLERGEVAERTAVPAEVMRSHDRLVEFLATGECVAKAGEEPVRIAALADEQFIALEELVNGFFDDGWEQASWKAFAAERLRRFGTYG